METTAPKNHIGRKILRLRELRGMKQEMLAEAMGVSQQTVSLIENSEEVDEKRLKQVAEALGVSPEAIKNFSEEAVFNIIQNTFTDQSSNNNNYLCTINPLEKLLESLDENKKLYERLIQAERELTLAERDKVGYLERLMGK